MSLNVRLEKALKEAHKRISKDKDLLRTIRKKNFDEPETWDLRRVIYDEAVGMKWDRRVKRPFIDNAASSYKSRALKVAEYLIKKPNHVIKLLEQSKDFRKGS